MAKKKTKNPETEQIEQVVEEPTPVEIKPIVGVVSGCKRLNVRKKADIKSDVICIVDAKAKLTIDPDRSNDEWFRVCTDKGVKGFCMSKYVTVKP